MDADFLYHTHTVLRRISPYSSNDSQFDDTFLLGKHTRYPAIQLFVHSLQAMLFDSITTMILSSNYYQCYSLLEYLTFFKYDRKSVLHDG